MRDVAIFFGVIFALWMIQFIRLEVRSRRIQREQRFEL